MCGIVGIINYTGSVSREGLQRANGALRHCGPDYCGIHVIRAPAERPYEVGLANRRLTILYLSPAGYQPVLHPETGNWIVYNGEVYSQMPSTDTSRE
jgi:asparagine synthase (glutamine-hydrolysing)